MAITITDINGFIGQVNIVLPAALAAYKVLFGIYKQAHPDATFEDFNAVLLTDSLDVQATSVAWLIAHGYSMVDGKWVKAYPVGGQAS